MIDLFPSLALLLYPTWYGGPPDEVTLPLKPHHYEVRHAGDRTFVAVIATGQVIYQGIGPAEVVALPAA
jgi:hypothetical protein